VCGGGGGGEGGRGQSSLLRRTGYAESEYKN